MSEEALHTLTNNFWRKFEKASFEIISLNFKIPAGQIKYMSSCVLCIKSYELDEKMEDS